MNRLNMEYFVLDSALTKVKAQVSKMQDNQVSYFFQGGEKNLLEYRTSVEEAKKFFNEFLDIYNDWKMEMEQKEIEAWKEDQINAQEDYYSEKGE